MPIKPVPMAINYRPTRRIQLDTSGDTPRTHQSFRDQCNVNNIMARFEKTGLLDHVNQHQGDYGNFIGFADYHSSMIQIEEAKTAFLTIPAAVRSKFGNDPGAFLAFAQDPENLDEMIQMGLAPPRRPDGVTAPIDTSDTGDPLPAPDAASDAP